MYNEVEERFACFSEIFGCTPGNRELLPLIGGYCLAEARTSGDQASHQRIQYSGVMRVILLLDSRTRDSSMLRASHPIS